jgi:predicted DNA-binding WGR domain protein
MAVVSSIQHVAITNDYNDGAACLKNYLRYADALSAGDVDAAKRVLKGITRWHDANSENTASDEDHVCRQLASTLRQRGYIVNSNVGQSHFRVDLAVRGRDNHSYRLGILIDTQIKYEQSDTLEREMMRPRLLKSFGWRLSTVLAKDWYLDRSKEIERILELLERSDSDAADVLEDTDEDDSDIDDEPNGESAPNREISPGPSDDILNLSGADADHKSVQDNSESLATSTLLVPTTAEAPKVTDGSVKYLEFRDDRSSKFWEISLQGDRHTVRFGRIGTEGQSQTKIFPDRTSAARDADRLVREKTRKGYRESPTAKS